MPRIRRTRAVYVISVAAELAGMHPQTLRQYERRGLVNPARTRGGNRRYSDDGHRRAAPRRRARLRGDEPRGHPPGDAARGGERPVCATSWRRRRHRRSRPPPRRSGASAVTSCRCARPSPCSARLRRSSPSSAAASRKPELAADADAGSVRAWRCGLPTTCSLRSRSCGSTRPRSASAPSSTAKPWSTRPGR